MAHRRTKRSVLSENLNENLVDATLRNSRKRAKKTPEAADDVPKNIFTRLVGEAGITLSVKGNKISTVPVLFQQKLDRLILSRSDDLSETIESFRTALEESIENEKFFVCCLMPTELSVALDDLGLTSSQMPNSIQDSVMKMLMHCKNLQTVVIKSLIKKLPIYAEAESVNVDPCFGIAEGSGADIINMPRLILNQLRWIDVVSNSTEIASEFLDMSSIMRSEIACDIIGFIPDLLPDDCDHEAIVLDLCELLSSGPENIASAVFDALSNLCLSEEVKKSVYKLATSHLTTASIQDIPVIVKYLLRSCESIDVAKQVITVLRPHLDFAVLLSNASEENEESLKTNTSLIADIMSSCMQFRTHIGAAWLSVLEKIASAENNVGDVIALFLLCNVSNTSQSKSAVNLFHSKLKRGSLPSSVLKKTIRVCSHIISSHFKSIKQLTQALLWQSDPSLKQAAALMYEEFLLNLDSFCKQETVGLLVEHISSLTSSKDSETGHALEVLCNVALAKPSVLVPYANFLRDALDRMDSMTIEQVRKSYHVLSFLAFSSDDALTLGMRDDLHMTLQKQLTNISDRFRHIGIIGSVTMLNAMSKTVDEKEVFDKVNSLFELMMYVLRNDVRGWSLFFDEVFIALQCDSKFPAILAKKLNDEAQSKLQERFLTDYDGTDSSCTSNDISCCYRYGLLSAEEQKETELGIKLTPLLFNSQNRFVTTMLCSLFRSISSLERCLTGALGEIDALLCCPILLHDISYENKTKFSELSVENQMFVFDSLFGVLNWFRELISVFSTENDPEVESNVLVRLKQICDLQASLDTLLAIAPDNYSPIPVNSSNIDVYSQKQVSNLRGGKSQPSSKPSTSTQKEDKLQNASISSSAFPPKLTKIKKEKKSVANETFSVSSSTYRPFLRELSKDIFVLFKHPLQCQPPKLQNELKNDEKYLRPRHLLLLINDLNQKLKHRLGWSKLPVSFGHQLNAGIGFDQIDQVPAVEVAEIVVNALPSVCRHLEDINSYFQKDDVEDLDESLSSVNDGHSVRQHEKLVSCYESIIESFYHLLSWHGLDEEGNKDLLQKITKILSSRLSSSSEQLSWSTMLSNSFRYIQNFAAGVPTSYSAHMLLKLLVTLHDFADDCKSQETWMAKKLSSIALEFLMKDWSDMASIANSQKRNAIITGLFQTHLKYNEDVLESIEQFLKTSLSYLLDDPIEKEEAIDSVLYPCLTKTNFYLFYRAMIETLGTEASSIPSPSKSSACDVDNVDLLLQWSEVVKVLDMLIRVLKTFPSRVMLSPAMKYARSTVESFIRTGIPVCEVTFREHQDDVINLLKKVQISTRQLQHVACHSKVAKDTSLTNHVPALKRCLETFVFRVKAMLVLHNCQDAFWLGNLKNRNLQGEELLSQMHTSPSSIAEEVQETTDATTSNAEEENGEQSYSESY